jgi:hypothetical protein
MSRRGFRPLFFSLFKSQGNNANDEATVNCLSACQERSPLAQTVRVATASKLLTFCPQIAPTKATPNVHPPIRRIAKIVKKRSSFPALVAYTAFCGKVVVVNVVANVQPAKKSGI